MKFQLSLITIALTILLTGCNVDVVVEGDDTITNEPTTGNNDGGTVTEEPTPEEPVVEEPPVEELEEPVPSVEDNDVSLSWDVPTTRENGESLFVYQIGGYEIRYKEVGASEYEYIYVDDGSEEGLTITNMEVGNYEFSIAAYDVEGLYSDYSDSVSVELT